MCEYLIPFRVPSTRREFHVKKRFQSSAFFMNSRGGGFPGFPVLGAELRLHVLRHRLVLEILHGEFPLPLRHGPQLGGVPEHVLQRHHARDDHVVPLRDGILDRPFAAVDVPDDSSLELARHGDLHLHDRFENFRFRFVVHLPKRAQSRQLKRHLARVHGVRRAVRQHHAHALHRVADETARLRRFLEPLVARQDVPGRDGVTDDPVLEHDVVGFVGFVSARRRSVQSLQFLLRERFDVPHHAAVLP
mmetsp:Transcript_12152/g.50887  ORF Transcript_12152/g.50887 Transcript_12152/m.50887 type:complete len:247 (-) Transcript_12152:1525-2265(-)